MNDKPSKLQTLAVLVLISGILNIVWGGIMALVGVPHSRCLLSNAQGRVTGIWHTGCTVCR